MLLLRLQVTASTKIQSECCSFCRNGIRGVKKKNAKAVLAHDGPDLKRLILVGWDLSFRLLLGPPGLN